MKLLVTVHGIDNRGRKFIVPQLVTVKDGDNVTRVSLHVDDIPHPICDMPMSLHEGYWVWIPPFTPTYETDKTD